ncbi:hypothetical protein pkur_cds_551 [Pandoravirus kuranda]|uniref:Uncharacterized protein n=2 Tax=Pandoravirus TaxID=2060084 RepID=A0AA95EEY1_9VIRU|nr:hypothetical protein pneo_cds_586 [Pandoravirus neocaledonia]AVK76193.1 hypothetical protein pneo_cds_586 [Pandoravirus neocaledonia]WBR14725.1 hypothetical protein pkur_cds_551 [Pandoravirus kuranda]
MQGTDEGAGGDGSGSAQGDFVSLPGELWETIAQSGLNLEDVQRLAATNPSLAWLGPRIGELRQRRALAATATACRDYLGCANAFLRALADDDADTALALTRSGRIPLDEPVVVPTLTGARDARQSLVGIASIQDAGQFAPVSNFMEVNLPYNVLSSPAGYPYATPLSLAAAAGAERTLARLIRDGAAAWPSPEALLVYALRLPLAIYVHSQSEPVQDAIAADADESTTFGPWRRLDTARIVDRITAAYPRSSRIGPWDRNPLQVLASEAVGSVPSGYQGDTSQWPQRVVEIARVLVDAGYSPDEPALGEAAMQRRNVPDRRTVRQRARDDLVRAQAQGDAMSPDVILLQALNDFYDTL